MLRLLADGLSNREIAQALVISEHTAKFHVASLLNKLGASTRSQAVALAVERGLLKAGWPPPGADPGPARGPSETP